MIYNFAGGFDFIIIDSLTSTITEITVIFLRFFFAAIEMGIIVFIRKSWPQITLKEFCRVAVCAPIEFSLYYTLEAIGMHKTSGALVSIVLSLVHVFGLIGGKYFL